ncbi:MAG: tetratricopeptide repeat protein [Kofleriaceae bacterium]
MIMAAMSGKERTWLAVVIVAYVALFARATAHDFVWDDVLEIETNAAFDRPLLDGLALTQVGRTNPDLIALADIQLAYDSYRPVLFATFWVEVAVFGRSAAPMHVTNLVLGLLALLLAHALARRWLAAAAIDGMYAIVATAIFALHPIQVESIAYISARGDLLAGLFALSSAYAATRATSPANAGRVAAPKAMRSRSTTPRWHWYALAALAFAASLFTKESYLGLPVALLLVAAVISGRAGVQTWWRIIAVMIVVAIGYLGVRAALVTATSGGALGAAIVGLPGVWLEYLRIVVLPFDLSTERLHVTAYTPAGWLVVGLVIAMVIVLRKRELPAVRVAVAGLGWFAMLIGPAAVSVLAMGVAADRYAYAAMLGIGIAIAVTVARVTRGRRVVQVVVGVWGAVLLVIAWLQVGVWADNRTLYAHAVQTAPDSSEAHYRLGYLDAQAGDWEHALPLLQRAVELDDTNIRALNNLGVGLMQIQQWADAERVLQRAVDQNPAHFRSWFNLGAAQLQLGRRVAGCASIRHALEVNPSYARARSTYDQSCKTSAPATPGLR